LGCLISEKFSDKLSVNHEPIGDPNPGGFGVRKVMLDISEGVGDMGISIDKPVGGVPASEPRHKKKKFKPQHSTKGNCFSSPKTHYYVKNVWLLLLPLTEGGDNGFSEGEAAAQTSSKSSVTKTRGALVSTGKSVSTRNCETLSLSRFCWLNEMMGGGSGSSDAMEFSPGYSSSGPDTRPCAACIAAADLVGIRGEKR
jgi:hypothetical protein